MKRILITITFALCAVLVSAQAPSAVHSFTGGLRYNEGLAVYKQSVLVSNFGCAEFNPLNTEGKGYITAITGNDNKMFIAPDGFLSAPKGMAIHQHHLFIADVNKVVVYNLRKLRDRPRVIQFPEGEMFVNDIAVMGDIVLVTVTNTGNIFGIDASNIDVLGKPNIIGRVPGANGIIVNGGRIYCASYNAGGTPSEENVIYYADIATSASEVVIKPLIKGLKPGQYDGLALTANGATLYFSSWTGENGGVIYSYALNGETPVRKIDFGVEFGGPADICIFGGMIYIPDLPKSTLYRFSL